MELFFSLNKEGKIKSVAIGLQPGLSDIVFEKESTLSQLSKEDLEKYTGDFTIGP